MTGTHAGRPLHTRGRPLTPLVRDAKPVAGTTGLLTFATRMGVEPVSGAQGLVSQGIELRHLRYFAAVADAGSFTHAAERMFIAQPTLSQQIRRLEEMVGAPLLQRRRDGVRLTVAGAVLLEESQTLLSLLEHGVSRARQAAGLGRPRLRVALPPSVPELLAVETASRLRSRASAADIDVEWLEAPLDAEFSLIRQRRADAGLGWLASNGDSLPDLIDVMNLGEFEPDIWLPSAIEPAHRGAISLDELSHMDVIHGPRRISARTYDAWLSVLRSRDPRFEFLDPPLRHSLPMALAFAGTATRPTAVLTGPLRVIGTCAESPEVRSAADTYEMVSATLEERPLTATAVLAWNGDLPRDLQQVLFETADGIRVSRPRAADSNQERQVASVA
jgi:DNA-binding transcriptional LysR family regulator